MATFDLIQTPQRQDQRRFELLGNLGRGNAVIQSALRVLRNDGATRVIQAGKEILRGERDLPQGAQEFANLFANTLFGDAGDPYPYVSKFDTPVRNYLVVLAGEYTVLNREGQTESRTYDQILIDSALITPSLRKNIVKTRTNGRKGTRKVYVSDGDYEITISGILSTDMPTTYPTDDFRALKEVLDSNEPLSVVSPQLARNGITEMLVESFSFSQEPGVYNTQKFVIKAISNEPSDVFIEVSNKTSLQENSRIGTIVDAAITREQDLRAELQSAIDQFFGNSETPEGGEISL
ncbi:MAG: DUF6046 domain-containing protein [Bacteroidota bacterium]